MKLSLQQFEQLFQENRLILSFIGMSNIGKTYWSKKFCDIGFRYINCDDLIEARLSPVLKKLGYSGIADVSRWMGQPYDERFSANQQKYLSLEKETMESIFARIKKLPNTVIDTTGSVIHAGENLCAKLKQYSLVIFIEATENMKEEMFHQYLKEPKPVVFGDVFDTKAHETPMDSLKRCYRKLLDVRSALYAQSADIIIPRRILAEHMNVHQFISLIKQSL